MLNKLARLIIATSALCVMECFAAANVAQARPVNSLLPLQHRTVENAAQGIVLDQVAESMNTQIAAEQALLNAPIGIRLDTIPIIKELVGQSGKFDTGVNVGSRMPISVSFGHLMGNGVLVLGTDFAVD